MNNIQTQIKVIEDYLNSQKNKTPEDVRFAKKHLLLIKKEAVEKGENIEDEFNYVKTHYHGQLARSPAAGNYIAIMAIISSVIIGILGVVPLVDISTNVIFFTIIMILLGLLCYIIINNGLVYKKYATYTIIVNLIEEILKK